MRTIKVGKSDVNASVVGFGTWPIGGAFWGGSDKKEALVALKEATAQGLTLIDTAPVYGFGVAEEIVGEAIAGVRDKVVISTKCGLNWEDTRGTYSFAESGHEMYRYLGAEFMRQELENSLRRLKTDYIDIYYTHWQDKTTPLEETMDVLKQFKAEGKIRAIGASNINLQYLQDYDALGGIDVGQEEYSLLNRKIEKSMLPFCQQHDIGMFAYCPLAQGLLTGKIHVGRKFNEGDMRAKMKSFSVENIKKAERLNEQLAEIAKGYDATLAQLIIAWTIAQPGITNALFGARNVEQLRENIKAAEVTINADDLARIRQLAEQSDVTFAMST